MVDSHLSELNPGETRFRDDLVGIVDADVHADVPSIDALLPYLSPRWQEFIRGANFKGPYGYEFSYPPGAPTTVRPGVMSEGGSTAYTGYTGELDGGIYGTTADVGGSSLELVQHQVLDLVGVEAAIINCYYGTDTIRHADFSAALASAVNDWLINEWLERDGRLRASIVIGGYDVDVAAQEIDRVGGHPGFVQVLLPARSEKPYGNRYWHPVFKAIERNDLVAGLHFGGMQGNPPTSTGWTTHYIEDYVGMATVFHSQVTSVIIEGLFEVCPHLRMSLLECGFTWMPSLMWRLDKEWKGLRRETPWVKRMPSLYWREHMRATTAPLDFPHDSKHMVEILEWLDSDELLMYASDFPHNHVGHIDQLLELLDPGQRRAVMAENARKFYRLPPTP